MKNKTTIKKGTLLLFCMLILFPFSNGFAQCTTGNGSPNTFTPNYSGDIEYINYNVYNGRYEPVNIQSNRYYTFIVRDQGDNYTDYITITNQTGTVVYAHGPSPLFWESNSNTGVIRYYTHSSSNCTTNTQPIDMGVMSYTTLCKAPTNLTRSTTSSTATLNWVQPTPVPANGYQYYYTNLGDNPFNTASAGVSGYSMTNTATINGLWPNNTYTWFLRSSCGTKVSAWIEGGPFTTTDVICNPPTNLTVNNITSTSAVFSWQDASPLPANGYKFFYNTTGATPWNEFDAPTNTATALSLLPNTTYYYWVKSDCGFNDFSEWVFGGTFYTSNNSGCNPPSSLTSSNYTSNSALISWGASTSSSATYDVYFGTSSTAPISSTTPTGNITQTSALLNNLVSGTIYYYWIRSNCGGITSPWVAGGAFSTLQPFNCNGANNGLYPAATFTPGCTGANEVIATDTYAGEYTNVQITANKQYTFSSSVSTDFMTITNQDGTALLSSGNTPLIWSSGSNTGIVRYYLHSNAACGNQNSNRTRSIRCPNTLSLADETIEGLELFPNPTNSVLQIKSPKFIRSVEIMSFIGETIDSKHVNSQEGTIDLSAYAPGIYLLNIFFENENHTVKIVKN